MSEYKGKKDKLDILFMKIKLKIGKFLKTKFGRYLWQITSSASILIVAGGIGVFAAYAKTEGSSMSYAKEYFKYFMTHSWSLMYGETDLVNSKFINETSFGEMMGSIVPGMGTDDYKFVDRGTDGTYHIIDVVYKETGGDAERTMTLRMKKQDEKALFILDQWEVCMTDEIIKKCTITAPAGVSVSLDGISLADCEYTDNPENGARTFVLGDVLAGYHRVTLTSAGSSEVYENFIWDASRSNYVVAAADFPISDNVKTVCADNTIDMIIGMYTGVLTDSGCDSVKEFFSTDEYKAGIDAAYENLKSQINREDGSTLVTMTFDSYNTEVIDYLYGRSFGIKFTFGTTFSAKGSRTELSGVRETYEGNTQGDGIVRFSYVEGQWIPTGIEMNCFDYSKQEVPEE